MRDAVSLQRECSNEQARWKSIRVTWQIMHQHACFMHTRRPRGNWSPREQRRALEHGCLGKACENAHNPPAIARGKPVAIVDFALVCPSKARHLAQQSRALRPLHRAPSPTSHTAAIAACARSISAAPTGLRVVIISINTSKRYAESCGPGLASG